MTTFSTTDTPAIIELTDAVAGAQHIRSTNDPDAGGDLADLLQAPATDGPADFADFWRRTAKQAADLPLNIERSPCDRATDRLDVQIVHYDSWNGLRIGGWLVTPRGQDLDAGMVWGHGYGGRAAPDLGTVYAHTASIFPCIRGFDLSRHEDLPNNGHDHVVVGLDDRETYIHRGCVVDLWRAAAVLVELYPHLEDHLLYRGGSFGGGLGALALPWGPTFQRAHLGVPSFGNHRLRATLPCAGSGRSITQRMDDDAEAVLRVMDYYDTTVSARLIETPTQVDAALYDPAVPPAGQFAVFNAMTCPRRLIVRSAGHFTYSEQEMQTRELEGHIADWLGREWLPEA